MNINDMNKAKRDAEMAETKKFIDDMTVTRRKIMQQIDQKNQQKANVSGTIPCPVCGTGTVSYSRAGLYNGHITAKCDTFGCVSWIE